MASSLQKNKGGGLGGSLRALRTRKGLTLADLSKRTGMALSTLSKIENDRISLTYDKIIAISGALGVDIAELLSTNQIVDQPSAFTGRRAIIRKGVGKSIDTENYGHLYLATDLLRKHFTPAIAEIRTRSIDDFGELISHSGEEFSYVLEGAIDLHTELYAPVRLEEGDSIYFDSTMGHAYIAAAPGRCRVLTICSRLELESFYAKELTGANDEAAIPAAETAARRPRKAGRRSRARA